MENTVGGLNVSRETSERLELYLSLLKKWNPKINLVAPNTIVEAWDRHFVDSAQIYQLCPEKAEKWVDIGSGGGFPGMVIAILAAELNPERRVTLIESDQRKSVFLRTVARETGVEATVLSKRIEAAPEQKANVLSARALASLDDLLGFSQRHLDQDGTALFLKGVNAVSEIEMARKNWHFEMVETASKTNSQAVILKIKGVARA